MSNRFYILIIAEFVIQIKSIDVHPIAALAEQYNVKPLQNIKNSISSSNRESRELLNEDVDFENIKENVGTSTTKTVTVANKVQVQDPSLKELKDVLEKLLRKLDKIDKRSDKTAAKSKHIIEVREEKDPFLKSAVRKTRRNQQGVQKTRWGRWTDWSPCSVSCGKGREIRWRHCLEKCEVAETEMEEKTCQLPACAPSKLFGIQL